MSDWLCSKCNLRSGENCANQDCPGLAKAVGQAFRTQRGDSDLEVWKEVCYAHEAELEWLRADVKRLRWMLVYISEVCIRHDQGNETGRVLGYIADNAREALDPDSQRARRAKALSDLAEMDADLLDIDPEVKP